MTMISPQFGTLHPNANKAFQLQKENGNKPASIPEVYGKSNFERESFNDLFQTLTNITTGDEPLGYQFLNIDKYISPQTAGTLLHLASDSTLFPTEIPQEAQQILYNHFIAKEDSANPEPNNNYLQNQTINFNA